MGRLPRISVVTPSLNQGRFLERTLASVRSQDYPELEHIVVDGMSSDGTAEVLARSPGLRVIREPDRGQADAINKGLRVATGAVLCVLNSDDTFADGALRRVAAEFDASGDRQVVIGRCRFIDQDDRFLGFEHPSGFVSHRRVLEIWKGHALPQPSIFWTREVWDRCGPFDAAAGAFLDYDFFCRVSRLFAFHPVDQVLANYRLHGEAQTAAMTDAVRLDRAIAISRRHWGPPTTLLHWRLRASLLAFRIDRRRRAVGLMRRGREAWRRGRRVSSVPPAVGGALLAPDVLSDVVLWPALRALATRTAPRRLLKPPENPHTRAWRDFRGVHADGWVGPVLVRTIDVPSPSALLHLRGAPWSPHYQPGLTLSFFVDDRRLAERVVGDGPSFEITVPLGNATPGPHEVRIEASAVVVPDRHLGNRDHRPLAFRLDALDVRG